MNGRIELSIWLVRMLFVAGWVILILGIVFGFVLADQLEKDAISTGRDPNAGMFFLIVVGTIATTLFASMLTWAAAYIVSLLSDIEENTSIEEDE